MSNVELEVSGLPDSATRHVADGATCCGFVEGGTYAFRCQAAAAGMFVDDVQLQQVDGSFTWQPGFYAGQVQAELVAVDGHCLGRWMLDVGPVPEKLGNELFQAMVSELLCYKPEFLLGATAQQEVFSECASAAPPEVQYVRLTNHARECCDALQRVRVRPIARLMRDRNRVALHRVQRMDHRSTLGLIRGHALPALQGAPATGGESGLVDVPVTRASLDNAANRTMAWMLRRLAHRVVFLMEWLRNDAMRDESARPKCVRRRQVLAAFHRELKRALRQPPFSDVARVAISSAGLTAISADPTYARAFRLVWQSLLTGVGAGAGADSLPISPTWQVYERWCCLCVVDIVRAMFPEADWREQSQGSNVDQFRMGAVCAGYRLSVCMQRRFAAWNLSGKASCRSLSRERIPDIILTASGPRGDAFMVLDAKYRVSRGNVLEAMQSAHVYRDSLLYRGQRPWRSLLLVPNAAATPWLADPEFRHRFAVGVIAMRERGQIAELRKVLELFFTQACGMKA